MRNEDPGADTADDLKTTGGWDGDLNYFFPDTNKLGRARNTQKKKWRKKTKIKILTKPEKDKTNQNSNETRTRDRTTGCDDEDLAKNEWNQEFKYRGGWRQLREITQVKAVDLMTRPKRDWGNKWGSDRTETRQMSRKTSWQQCNQFQLLSKTKLAVRFLSD